jgi:SLT domain-containing protein
MMERIAASLETVANAINSISNAYQAALPALRFIQNPLNINLPEAGFTPRPKARAAGGSVMGGQAYRVGEFGPELFVPSGSGSIRPDAGNGGGVTIIMNGIIDGESARRSIEKLLQDSARRTGAVNFVGATL